MRRQQRQRCPRSTIRRAKEDNSGWDERQYLLDYVSTLKEQGWFPRDLEVTREMLAGSNIPVGMGLQPSAGDRMLVVGDAGGFVSPLSGEGLYYAVDSGQLAAETLAGLFEHKDFSKTALMDYHRAWRNKWGEDRKSTRLNSSH